MGRNDVLRGGDGRHGKVLFVYLPYCIELKPNGSVVVLNREFKPLGFKTKKVFEYEDYPILTWLRDFTPEKMAQIVFCKGEGSKRLYLYDDTFVPTDSSRHMSNYLERLSVLADLDIVPGNP